MKIYRNNWSTIVMVVILCGLLPILVAGCTNVQHQVKLNKDYIPKEDVSIKVAKVINDTGFDFDIDIEEMLADALEDQLLEEDLLWLGGKQPVLFMESTITGYKKGSAFKRWMMPGWGATELSIRCELKDDKNNRVGSAIASREVVAGGGYTIGAWKTVFKDVASDVAEDLRHQIESKGYVVQPKNLPEKATEKPIAAFSPAKVDPTEPWTGVWRVEGSRMVGGIWGMKQSGRIVKSTEDSYYDFKGKVRGNQLEGKIKGDFDLYRNFVIKISSDGLTFEGQSGTHHLRGKRKAASMASVSPVSLNSEEPWTGKWKVEGSAAGGVWRLKQNGKKVISTAGSFLDLAGRVEGNKLIGRRKVIGTPIVLKISPDGMSFEGHVKGQPTTYFVKGKRLP